nr:sn-glycerol-3-phosphate ABC transporter ATP-binding protein UgpC [Devosia faecipullorum]
MRKSFGAHEIIQGVDLTIADGEFCVFAGPSGCGKSTLLRMIAGLETASGGSVSIGGRDVTALEPAQRRISMVFQSYALYPHMSVAENIGFGLKMTGHSKAVIAEHVAKAAKLLQLEPLLERRPAQLSGGQRQRVAIGRAIVRDPDVFLFDEPLSNLDASLRVQMRVEISNLHKDLGATMIYVTHDQVEALTMADKIVVLRAGKIEQVGGPLELYHEPANVFVASFIGSPSMNLIPVALGHENGVPVLTLAGDHKVQLDADFLPAVGNGTLTLGVRPEHVNLDAGDIALPGVTRLVERLGSETMLHVTLADGENVVVKAAGTVKCRTGDAVTVYLSPAQSHFFDAKGVALRHPERPS